MSKIIDISEHNGDIDFNYDKPRKKGHRLTKEELAYIKNDILIPSKVLKMLFDENLTKMTQGSNALKDYKEIISSYKEGR